MARWFFPHHGGGTIRTYQTAKNLVKLGNEVHLIVHHSKSIPHVTLEEEVKKYEEVEGVHVYRLPYIGPQYLYYSIVIPLMAFYAIRIIMKNKIDVILSHNPPYLVGMSSWIASKVTGVPMIINVHDAWGSTHYGSFESKFGLFLEKFCCKRVNRIITVNETLIKTLNSRHGIPMENFEVIPNAVDTERFDVPEEDAEVVRNNYKIPKNKKIIFFVGNLANWNGPEHLVRAVPYIKNKDAFVLMVGGGKQEKELKEISKDYNNIIFTGTVSYHEVPLLMNLADVCVAPLTNPGTVGRAVDEFMVPHLLLEYMGCGKPIVGTDVPGLREMLSNNRGFLVKPENPEDIARGIDYLLEHEGEAEKMEENARNYIKKERGWVKVAKRTEELLERELK